MLTNELDNIERRETILKLSELLTCAQQMGKRLADETHGDDYSPVRRINELLHEAHQQLNDVVVGAINYGSEA